MKKHGILNRDIARVLAQMGHTDSIVIADCGLPIPAHVPCIDLSIKQGVPTFADVLHAVLDDFVCERALFASEAHTHNPAIVALANTLQQQGCQVQWQAHEQFKQATAQARAIIRTGEASPYANVVLYSGVIF